MKQYDRLMAVLNGNKDEVDSLPVINSVGTYTLDTMKVYEAYWPEAHKNPEKMARLAAGLHRLTEIDNITLPFELTFEAEIFGAPIEFFENKTKWPTVKKFVAHDISDLHFPKDISTAGRVTVVTKAIEILNKEFKGKIPIIAYVNCPFTSISSYLVEPTEFLKCLKREPKKIHEFYRETYPYYAEIANIFREAGADIITYREEGASLDNISPRSFNEFVKPYLTRMISLTKSPRILHICGQCISGEIEIISKMVECGAEAITIDERTSVKATREIADRVKRGYPIGGNVNAFTVIHEGPIEKIRAVVKCAIDEGVDMVAPGCDFWLETPTEHIKAFVDAAREFGTPPPWTSKIR